MTLVFFYLVNLRTRFDETLCRMSDSKNIGRGFVDQSSNPDSNPGPDIKILGRKFKSSAESFRFATGYLKLRYQTGCSNEPRYFHVFLPRCHATLLFLLHIFNYSHNSIPSNTWLHTSSK